MNIWYNKGMLPCWAIVYFDEGDGPQKFQAELKRRRDLED